MIELLSLPRRSNKTISVPNIKFQSGLPINSLPGWEHIPLNRKLPMLKCPENQVTFSKNKIGQSLRHLKHEFDTYGHESIPEYNPLQDSNLRTFYANETNLKRLRENGEITMDNDVICNLKDFNEYRQQLHKSKLYYVTQEMNRLEAEQRDRKLILNAESLAHRNQQQLVTAGTYSHSKIMQRKLCIDQQRAERFRKLHERTLKRLLYIQKSRSANKTVIQRKKLLQKLRLQKHADIRSDLQRKRLISLKKLSQFKKERLQANLKKRDAAQLEHEQEKQLKSWNKRLEERIATQAKVDRLLEQVNEKRKLFIKNHSQYYQMIWHRIQQDIKKRSMKNRKVKNKQPPKRLEAEASLIAEFKERFEKLLDSEVCEALNVALDMEKKAQVPFERTDPIYRAAQYIMQVILKKVNRDLSQDNITYKNVYSRIDKFFDDAKKFVIFRATQIIASFQTRSTTTADQSLRRVSVVFSKFPSTIGISSYQIHPLIEVKDVSNRKPTPAGSLTSLIVDSSTSLIEKNNCSKLSRNELIFIEHYFIKLKRELIVGIGHKVFAAIECHYEKKIMDVRQELLDIDRKFLVNQATKSILSYAINPLNFVSALKLCSSALANDIIWSLQSQLLKPTPDRRRIVKPSFQRGCKQNSMQLCLFCNERK